MYLTRVLSTGVLFVLDNYVQIIVLPSYDKLLVKHIYAFSNIFKTFDF